MATWLRNSLYCSLGALWLTGCAWLLLHFFFQRTTDFGVAPHPLQPGLLATHGVLAVAAVFFFGSVAGTHIGDNWGRRFNKGSGLALVIVIGTLTITGLCSYYVTTESVSRAAAVVHEALGVLAITPALIHWLRRRKDVVTK
jgi:hypothetical protein